MRLPSLHIENVKDGETIHQRCLLIKGRSTPSHEYNEYLSVAVTDSFGNANPPQTWPMSQGYFKALILLSPGNNTIKLERHHNGTAMQSTTLNLSYVPLVQTPPLHCAIMIAKDSPLLIDCPQYKAAGISSAHSSLDAAIAKFRTTAYMWQAMTAEDMRTKGLGRRSFRLDEEYGLETTSRASHNTMSQRDRSQNMGSVVKVHLVRSEKTTAEIRDPNVAQQNDRARKRDDLHKYFEEALKAHGGVFESSTHPVVAGMIFDAHFSVGDNLLLGHAALGCHNGKGLSLGVFGSPLTYSWPRFFEEIAASLTDTTPPGDSLYNDNGECETAWEACSIGQGAFLHEVGHAFGAPHTTGIMARGYAQDWPKNFIAHTGYCAKRSSHGVTVIDGITKNGACWDFKDALSFRCLPHFRIPGDRRMTEEMRNSLPSVRPLIQNGEPEGIIIESKSGIARIHFPNSCAKGHCTLRTTNLDEQHTLAVFKFDEFDRSKPLAVEVLGQNGKERKLANAWRLLSKLDFVRIPDSDVILHKRSVTGIEDENDEDKSMVDDEEAIRWAVMLQEKGPSGELSRANVIDLRVGCIMDGAVVYFADGHKTPCGPRTDGHGGDHDFGGGRSQRLKIPKDATVTKVEINRSGWSSAVIGGISVTLSTGQIAGELNSNSNYNYDDDATDNGDDDDGNDQNNNIMTLEPAEGERVVGFFGQSQDGTGYCTEFGIICVDIAVDLPPQTYDLEELQNTQGR